MDTTGECSISILLFLFTYILEKLTHLPLQALVPQAWKLQVMLDLLWDINVKSCSCTVIFISVFRQKIFGSFLRYTNLIKLVNRAFDIF